jgi:hypothetical protein
MKYKRWGIAYYAYFEKRDAITELQHIILLTLKDYMSLWWYEKRWENSSDDDDDDDNLFIKIYTICRQTQLPQETFHIKNIVYCLPSKMMSLWKNVTIKYWYQIKY